MNNCIGIYRKTFAPHYEVVTSQGNRIKFKVSHNFSETNIALI